MPESILDSSCPKLTHRERFKRLMHYQTVDRGVHWEFGYLGETMDRWHQEGLPAEITGGEGYGSVESYFGVDPVEWAPTNTWFSPGFEGHVKIVKEEENRRVEEHPDGTIMEVQIDGERTIPHYLKFPIENRDDWQRFKEKLDPASPERELDLETARKDLLRCDLPVWIGLGSFFGTPRNWIGFENIALMCYDDRPLVEEIVETLGNLYYDQLSKTLRYVQPDFAAGWEDICFRNGPMISPRMFREIVGPHLKRVCDLLRQHGCDVILTDCDGDVKPLIPVWLECGLNCMFPLEVQSGSDPVEIRKEYGKQILMRGGVNKHALSKTKKEILDEIRKLAPLVEEGGFIPGVDHRTPQDVSYENYKYYIREKLAMLGWSDLDVAKVWPLHGVESQWKT